MKSDEVPATTPAVLYPTRYFNIPSQGTSGYKDGNGIQISNLGFTGAGAANHSGPIGDTKPWSFSFWIKNATTGVVLDFNGDHNGSAGSDKNNGNFSFGIDSSTGQFYLHRLQWASTYMNAQFTGDITADSDWHHVVLSYKNTKADNTTVWNRLGHSGTSYTKDDFWSVDPTLNGPTTSINDMGFTLYIDGVRAPYDASNSTFGNVDTTWFASWLMTHSVSYGMGPYTPLIDDAIILGQKKHGYWTTPTGDFANIAFHDKTISAAEAVSLYNNGNPTDLSADPNCIVLLNPEGITASTSIADDTVLTNSGGSSSSSDQTCTVIGNAGDSAYSVDVEDASGESLYYEMIPPATTYSPILFRSGGKTLPEYEVLKYTHGHLKDDTNSDSENRGIGVQNVFGSASTNFDTDKNWSFSVWFKGTGLDDSGTMLNIGNWNHKGITLYRTSTTVEAEAKISGYDPIADVTGLTLDDGDWHNVTITFAPDSGDVIVGTDPATCNLLIYVDGVLGTCTAEVGNGDMTQYTDYTGNQLQLGTNRAGQVSADTNFCHFSSFTKTLSASEVNSILGANDKPKDLTGQSNLECWLPLGDGYDTANPSIVDTVVGTSAKMWDMSGNGRHGYPHQAVGSGAVYPYEVVDPGAYAVVLGWGQGDTPVAGVTALGSSENIYNEDPGVNFGEGMTISLTDKVKTDGTWSAAGNEDPHLLLSFDGFENDADQWVAWKCEQTDINPIPAETTPANLLDGNWHNLILSYRGVSSAGNSATFGRGGASGHDNAYWHLGWNGLKTDHLNTYHGVNASKSEADGQDVTLDMQDYHLKNVSDTYVRTSFFASGFLEDSVDSKYAFQGQIDETSFDSSSWWRNIGGEAGVFCDCPLEVVYGINDQRLTLPVGTANDNYNFKLLSLAPGKPHDLLDPLSVNTDPINNKKAYIDPYPTDQFRCSDGIASHTTKAICDANHSIHDSPKGLGAASTPPFSAGNTNWIEANENYVGGIEWYYRWGDVATDCKRCVKDARAFTLGVSAGEPPVDEDGDARAAAVKGTVSIGDLKASSSSNAGGAETIYIEGSSGGGGTTITYEDLVNDCVAAGENVITHLNIPHLHYLRLKYTGSSACVAGSCSIGGHTDQATCEAASGTWTEGDCIGDLFYSIRRKG